MEPVCGGSGSSCVVNMYSVTGPSGSHAAGVRVCRQEQVKPRSLPAPVLGDFLAINHRQETKGDLVSLRKEQ